MTVAWQWLSAPGGLHVGIACIVLAFVLSAACLVHAYRHPDTEGER